MRHFLQSESWLEFQEALGNEVVQQKGIGWNFSAIIERPKGPGGWLHKRLYVPYGPTCHNVQSFELALKAIKAVCAAKGLVYARIEPVIESGQPVNLGHYGLKLNNRPMQPDRTLTLDLSHSEQAILAGMSSTNRNLWNTYKSKGLKFRISYDGKDMPVFIDMMKNLSKRNQIIVHDALYFQTLAKSLFASRHGGLALGELNGKAIVAALFFDDIEAGVRYYAHAGSFDEARQVQANSPLLSYLIFDAKHSGRKQFDFFGVSPPNDEGHKWAGLSKFKRSFGATDKEYVGTWELPISRAKFAAARISRKLPK